jgi:cell division protein FtsB
VQTFLAFIAEPQHWIGAAISAGAMLAAKGLHARARQRAADRVAERDNQRALEAELRARVTGLEAEIQALRQQLAEWQARYIEVLTALGCKGQAMGGAPCPIPVGVQRAA